MSIWRDLRYAALARPLPFTQPDRLVVLWERSPRFPHNRVSPLNFPVWSDQQRAFASVAAIAGGGRTLTGSGGEAERIPGQAVTWQFFDVPGIRPIAGALPIVLTFDARVAVVAALLTVGTTLLFGLAPAWQAPTVPLAEMTSAGGRGSTRRAGGLRAALVVGEVAAAVLLLIGAGLLVRAPITLNGVDGFRAERVLTLQARRSTQSPQSPQ